MICDSGSYMMYARRLKCIELFQSVKCMDNEHKEVPDLDKMQLHILECLDALRHVKTLIHGENVSIDEKVEFAKDNVFASAISIILDDKSPYKKQKEAIQSYSSKYTQLNKSVGWLPLHWAFACGNKVTEEDVKVIYAADPMALSTRHLINPMHEYVGFTPIGLLLMSTRPNISLLLFFLKIHPEAFTISVGGYQYHSTTAPLYPLHFAAEHCESVEVLQMLLQVDTDIMFRKTNPDSGQGRGESPLGLLCRREEFPGF